MTEAAGLERGYRRLLAAYPSSFRREQAEEMLVVLMAGARQGQQRPGLAEAVDVIVSGLGMRLRRAGLGPPNPGWADSLAVLSLIAPLFVLAAGLLEIAVPYRLPAPSRDPFLFHRAFVPRAIGGLPLLHLPGLEIVLGLPVIIVALVLLGLRWVALVTLAVVATHYLGRSGLWLPDPLQALVAGACMLEAVALVVSPDSRRARSLLSWRYGVVLLLAAAAVQVLTQLYYASSRFAETGVLVRATAHSSQWLRVHGPGIWGCHLLLREFAIEFMSELEGVGAAAGGPSCDGVPLVPGGEAAGPGAPGWPADSGGRPARWQRAGRCGGVRLRVFR